MFLIRHSLAFCRFRSISFRPLSTTTTRPIRRRKQVASRLKQQTDEETEFKSKIQRNEMLKETNDVFVAKDKDGNELTMEEYLKFASLSPWVPVPDVVARRCLDIVKAGPDDIHYELGSGDGRVNFQAHYIYNVKKSVGVDIDSTLIEKSNSRKALRHPAPQNLQFVCADLMDRQNPITNALWDDIERECSILTMYFVEDALDKIKPLLERHILGRKCKVVTIGYAMKGWEPKWAEVVLGLTVYMYDMQNVDELFNQSLETNVDKKEDLELNVMSRKKLAEMASEENDNNPFGKDVMPNPMTVDTEEDESVDYHWDFDEHEVYEDDDNLGPVTKK